MLKPLRSRGIGPRLRQESDTLHRWFFHTVDTAQSSPGGDGDSRCRYSWKTLGSRGGSHTHAGENYVFVWLIATISSNAFNSPHNSFRGFIQNDTENRMSTLEPCGCARGDEELAPVGVGAGAADGFGGRAGNGEAGERWRKVGRGFDGK